MTSAEREPTREELLAMAYADGELALGERRAFEQLLAERPDLSRDVVRYQRLQVLAREAAPPEPMDHEWRRLGRDPRQRALVFLGWALACLGSLCLLGWAGWALATSDLALWPKLGLAAVLLGTALLLAAAVRARLRTRPFDPYLEIRR